MSERQVHYEVFARVTPKSEWKLELATEDRSRAVQVAEHMVAEKLAVGVKVIKETLDPATREYQSVPVLTRGLTETPKAKPVRVSNGPICTGPTDLYSAHAREKIGRLLDGWLKRNRVTPFELLHRPDLVERLDASGMEIQTAIQKIAVPEAQATGAPVHDLIRAFQELVERAVSRLLADGRKANFPDLHKVSFAESAIALAAHHDRAYRLGGGVAAFVGDGQGWSEKIDKLLDLAEAAPSEGRARSLAFHVLEQPLAEIMSSASGLSDLAGPDLDLGGSLAFLTRLVAAPEMAMLMRIEPALNAVFPPLTPEAERLGAWLQREEFQAVRTSLARRILKELNGAKRLRPSDATAEIVVLRALAMALTATGARLLRPEDVRAAFLERSAGLVSTDFVSAYLAEAGSAYQEAQALIRLAENVVGRANKRAAARWLSACVGALRFEKELRENGDTPASKLGALGDLQRMLRRCDLAEEDVIAISERLGQVGGSIEAHARIVQLLGRASAPVQHRLTALLKLAAAETGPTGPVAERAKAEAARLLREPGVRSELAGAPEALANVRALLGASGLAAA